MDGIKILKKFLPYITGGLSFFLFPSFVFAHEAYVLTREEFHRDFLLPSKNPFAPLVDPSHIQLFLVIIAIVTATRILVILFSLSPVAAFLDKWIRKASEFGLVIVRVAMAAAFLYAGQANVIFGPEIDLDHILFGTLIRFLLFALSTSLFLGVFVELSALVGLVLYFYLATQIGIYVVTYTNVLGELIVLFLFGSRYLSIDRLLFGTKLWIQQLSQYKFFEVPILRVFYGVALLFTAWTIKFAHQPISIAVYNEYHLGNFFHAGGDFIAAGAGLSEVLIGLFMLLGFSMRWTLFISLCFMTLSVWYFRELVWPHFILYGISIALFINAGDRFTFDHYARTFIAYSKKKLFHTKNR